MVDMNRKASEVGFSLLEEQRERTEKRQDEIKKYNNRKNLFDLGVGIYKNTVLDEKAETFALSNAPFKAKLLAMQGNASKILETHKTINSEFAGDAEAYWTGHYITQLNSQYLSQSGGKIPPRVIIDREARKLAKEKLNNWNELVAAAKAVPESATEFEENWDKYENLNVPSNVGELMGRKVRNYYRSEEEREEAERLNKANVLENPLFSNFKNFKEQFEIYSNINPDYTNLFQEHTEESKKWAYKPDPDFTPITETATKVVNLDDGSRGLQTVTTITGRDINGEYHTTTSKGDAQDLQMPYALPDEIDTLIESISSAKGKQVIATAVGESSGAVTLAELYKIATPYLTANMADAKIREEIDGVIRTNWEALMFDKGYYQRNAFNPTLKEPKPNTTIPTAESFEVYRNSRLSEFGLSKNSPNIDPSSLEGKGIVLDFNNLSTGVINVLKNKEIQDQVIDAEEIVKITIGGESSFSLDSFTEQDSDKDTQVELFWNPETARFVVALTGSYKI